MRKKKRRAVFPWLQRTANGDQSNEKGQNSEGKYKKNPPLLVCTMLLSILATQEYNLQYTDFELGRKRKKFFDSLNYNFFYLIVKSCIPVVKPNFPLLQAGPAPLVIGKHGNLHHRWRSPHLFTFPHNFQRLCQDQTKRYHPSCHGLMCLGYCHKG